MARGKTPAATDTADTADTADAVASTDDLPNDLPDHLFRWSDAVAQRLSQEMRALAPAELEAVGGRRARLLQMVPTAGMRVTDLAHRAGVTKQAIGQLVDTLEELGLVRSVPSRTDRRVRWVTRTPAGDAFVERSLALIAEAEDRLRHEVGARRYDAMLATMRQLGRDVTW